MTYTVQARGLHKAYREHTVLDGIDLDIASGSIFGLLGPNGAGKTTLVRILGTLLTPDSGSATIAGHDLLDDPVSVRRSIALTGQYAAVDDLLTGAENLRLMARLLRLSPRHAALRSRELLEQFDLTDAADRRTSTYSGGMRRRLDLAISMIVTPQLLVLDEPTTGLDPRSREQVWSNVRRFADEGVTVLLTTQYLEEADRLADRIAVLHGGRIVAEDTPSALKDGLGGDRLTVDFADGSTASAALALLGGRLDPEGRRLELTTDGSARELSLTLARLDAAGIEPTRVSTHQPTLDDVFFTLTEKELA
ncbi:ATP-binding cassette domain-containing protein [Aeromicrobium sp. CTD01-1L150]|uniref:ATP-binding cassette domain-containing protein n=1 Tax=Aeromicrobium sp. CTD01-1L150 TaxID=3341830 RepID=UPI0035C204FD